jgi:hypothetical protein
MAGASNGRSITNDKLYDALNGMRLELKSDINRVETKFDNLEAGRLTRLEERVSRGEVRQAINGTKLAVLVGSITLVVSAVVTVILSRMLR